MHFFSSRAAALGGLAALSLAALIPASARAQTQDLFVVNNAGNTVSRFAGTGPGAFSTTATTLSGGLNGPQGLAFDARGDLFVTNIGSNSITEFASTGPGTFGAGTVVETGLNNPNGLAFDARGDLFVVNQNGDSITEFPFTAGMNGAAGTFGAGTVIETGLNDPTFLAFDAHGDLFAANDYTNDVSQGSILEFAAGATPGTFGMTTMYIASSLTNPQGLAFDARGNLFVAGLYGNSITEFAVNPSTGALATVGFRAISGVVLPTGLAFDARGNLFVADLPGSVTEYAVNPATGTFGPAQTVETGLSSPVGLAFGPPVSALVLVSLSFPSPVPGGTIVYATVTLSGITASDVVVGLSSSDSSVVRLHRAVVVQAGSSSATFPINTFRSHVTQGVTITASLNGVVKTVPLTITGR